MKSHMKHSFNSLRARLIFLVLLIIVPVLGLIVYHGIEGRNKDRLEAFDEAMKLAKNASMIYKSTIVEAHQILFTLSQIPQFRQQDPAACSKILAELLTKTENYSGFSAVKPNGEVFASAPSMTKPISFADRPWFQRLVKTRSFVIGEYLVGRISGKPIIILGYPILDNTGQLIAVFAAGLDLEHLQKSFLNIDLPEGANLTVIDSNGTILLRYPDPEKLVGKIMPNKTIVNAMLTKKEGAEEAVGLGGVPCLYGYTTVDSGAEAIHISVGIPEQIAYADVKRHMIRDLTLLGLMSVFALLGAWLFGKILIISPVNRLIHVTKRLTDGDLTVRTGRSDDTSELGLLTSQFNQMADSLQSREEALRKNEEKYRLHFENVSDVIFSYDRDFKILSISPSVEQVLGYKPEEFIGKSFAELNILSPENLERAFSDTIRVFAGEHLDTVNYEFIARGGTIKYVEVSFNPLLREGQVMTVVSVARDITDRKRAEEALKEKMEDLSRLATVVSDSNDAVIMHDLDGIILAWNRGAKETYGYTETEALGKNVRDIVAETDREAALTLIQKIKQGEIVKSFELRRVTKDGRILDVWLTTTLLTDEKGKPVAIATTERDITARRLVEDKLRITQFAVDCAAEPIGWVGKDGRHLYVNDAYCRLLGYSKDELLSLKIYDLDSEISAKSWLDYWEKIKRQDFYVLETSRRSKNGVLIPLEIHANYLAHGDEEFIVNFCRDIRERKLHEEHLKRQFDRLAALRAIDMAITASLDIRVTFSVFLEQVIACLGVDAADVLLIESQAHNRLSFVAGRGFRTSALRHTNLKLGEGYAGRVAKERKTLCIPDLQKEAQDILKQSPQLGNEEFVSYYGTPLIAKGHVIGVLEIFNRKPLEPDQEWLDFLEALATQAAIAIDNAKLFDDLQKSNLDLIQAYDNTLEGWSNALDLRDKETEGHSQRVTEMTLRLAGKMGMSDSELVHVRRGALLHDIGKMGIPDNILLKPGALTDEEWVIMRKHPEYAYELLNPISHLRPALDIPYCHHEKWDGTGYPRGLKGEHIPLAARIFSIIDVWDALRSERPYRPAWPEEKTIEHIREQTGTHFDPKVVEAFLELLNELKNRSNLSS